MRQVPVESSVEGYEDALKSIRAARGFWSLLLVFSILVHVTAFALVEFAGLAPAEGPARKARSAASRPATRPAATQPASRPVAKRSSAKKTPEKADTAMTHIRKILIEALPIARLAAPISAAVLAATLFLGVLVSLSGRLGGAKSMVGAFLWSVVLVGVLVPWKELFADLPLIGALPAGGLGAIRQGRTATITGTPSADLLLYYLRYAAYPVTALLLWMTVHMKFARGYQAVQDGAAGVEGRSMP